MDYEGLTARQLRVLLHQNHVYAPEGRSRQQYIRLLHKIPTARNSDYDFVDSSYEDAPEAPPPHRPSRPTRYDRRPREPTPPLRATIRPAREPTPPPLPRRSNITRRSQSPKKNASQQPAQRMPHPRSSISPKPQAQRAARKPRVDTPYPRGRSGRFPANGASARERIKNQLDHFSRPEPSHDYLLVIGIMLLVFMGALGTFNLFKAWRWHHYCDSGETVEASGPLRLSAALIGQPYCTACPEQGSCKEGRLTCGCPFIEQNGECVRDPNEEAQIEQFADQLMEWMERKHAEQVCEQGQDEPHLTEAQVRALFRNQMGTQCNLGEMEAKLERRMLKGDFRVERRQDQRVFSAAEPSLPASCAAKLFIKDNLLLLIVGGLAGVYLLWKTAACYCWCQRRRLASRVLRQVAAEVAAHDRMCEEEAHELCGDPQVIDEFERLVQRDRSLSRLRKMEGGRAQFFFERRQ